MIRSISSGGGPWDPDAPAGLSSEEAAARLASEWPNAVARPRPRRLISRIAAQLTDPLVVLLLPPPW